MGKGSLHIHLDLTWAPAPGALDGAPDPAVQRSMEAQLQQLLLDDPRVMLQAIGKQHAPADAPVAVTQGTSTLTSSDLVGPAQLAGGSGRGR